MPAHLLHPFRPSSPFFFFPAVLLLTISACQDRSVMEPEEPELVQPEAKPPDAGPKTWSESLIAFQSSRDGNWEIYTMKADGSEQRRLTHHFASDVQPVLSPNGNEIVFTSNRAGNDEIYVMDADGSDLIRLTEHQAMDRIPDWSPDGKKIVFQSNRDGNWEIYVMDADGSNPTRLTDDPAADQDPDWSPDGEKIAYCSNRLGDWEIYVMNADGSNPLQKTWNPGTDAYPDWSPDGSEIAFESYRDDNMDIYVMDADGLEYRRLTNDPAYDWLPDWSPDGTQIAFYSDRVTAGDREIYVMNADGRRQSQLTDSEAGLGMFDAQNSWPSWGAVSPEDGLVAEELIGSSYMAWWAASQLGAPAMALSVAAEELTSSWRNWGMEDLSTEPRIAYDNTPSYTYRGVNEAPWHYSYTALSLVYEGIRMIDDGVEIGGPGGPDNARARAFGKFVQGLAHGWLALMFDRAFVLDEDVDLERDNLVLVPYTEVMAAAQTELEQAILLADANPFTLPGTWINGQALTNAELSQLAHSYLARMMTQVARTPEERSAVNWTSVIAHVVQGIQHDILIQGTWSWWVSYPQYYGSDPGWTRADYKTIGWLDTSGNFATWLATPVADRNEMEISTPDARITEEGGNPTGGGTDFAFEEPSPFYVERGTYHNSYYGHHRYWDYWASGGVGPIPHMTTVEMELIKAEGLLRRDGPAQVVADIINTTRVGRGQLEPASGAEPESFLMDKLIYEKRIEGFLLCGGCAFFDRRGFGPLAPTGPGFHQGLVEGTHLHFPIPGRELERLGLPYYTFGGPGNEMGPSPVSPQAARVAASEVYRFSSEMTAAEMLAQVKRELKAEGRGGMEVPRIR